MCDMVVQDRLRVLYRGVIILALEGAGVHSCGAGMCDLFRIAVGCGPNRDLMRSTCTRGYFASTDTGFAPMCLKCLKRR